MDDSLKAERGRPRGIGVTMRFQEAAMTQLVAAIRETCLGRSVTGEVAGETNFAASLETKETRLKWRWRKKASMSKSIGSTRHGRTAVAVARKLLFV